MLCRARASITLPAIIGSLLFVAVAATGAKAQALDSSIAGFKLLDANSSAGLMQDISGTESQGYLEYRFANADRNQTLVLVQHPGAARFEISEARVLATPAGKTLPIFPGEPSNFASGLGVRLGLSRAELTQILGPPQRESEHEFEYHLTLEKNRDRLQSFNMPEYRGVYQFGGDRLVRFEFGFPYP